MIPALRYEWRRLFSIRSTWIISVLYLALVGVVGLLPIFVASPAAQSWEGLFSTPGNVLNAMILSVIAAQTFGHEYRYGVIRLTLSEFPAREKILIAKTLILSTYVVAMTLLAWAVLGAGGLIAGSEKVNSEASGFTISESQNSTQMWQVLAFGIGYCIFAMSITMLSRNLALGVTLPLLLATILEPLVGALLGIISDWFEPATKYMPLSSAQAWIVNAPDWPQAGLVFAAWVVGIYFLASFFFIKRDA